MLLISSFTQETNWRRKLNLNLFIPLYFHSGINFHLFCILICFNPSMIWFVHDQNNLFLIFYDFELNEIYRLFFFQFSFIWKVGDRFQIKENIHDESDSKFIYVWMKIINIVGWMVELNRLISYLNYKVENDKNENVFQSEFQSANLKK
jgi:hypothetical protein